MKFTLLLLCLLSLNVFSALREDISIVDGKQITLKGESCAVLMEQAEAILSWAQKLGENMYESVPECYCSSSSCILNVYDISPKMVQTYQGVNPQYNGPNCWNRALVFAKILPSLTYTTPEEMTFWMGSALCRERLPEEEAQPGDIIVVRDFGYYSEVHGFTYLTDDMAFSKNGYKKYSAYEYQSLSSVFDVYRVSDSCRRVFGRPEQGDECFGQTYANYFNCMSLEEYFSTLNVGISDENYAIYQRLLTIDREVFSYLFNEHKTLDEEQLKGFREELRTGISMGNEILEAGNLSEGEVLFWNALMRRAEALEAQIGLMVY